MFRWLPNIPMRWKFLFLLLTIALAPLSLVSHLASQSTLQLGMALAERTQETQIREVRLRLLQWIEDKAAFVEARKHLLEQTLRAQAREVEHCLQTTPPQGMRAYFAEDFDMQGNRFPGTILDSKHQKYDVGISRSRPIAVNYQEQAFHLAPGLTRTKARRQIASLAPMARAYEFLFQNDPALIYWQYTALENGLSCSYPGHGGEPADYDPRLRPWYMQAKQTGAFVSFGPYVDASTQELVLTLSMPIYGSRKQFAGVTALDIQVDDLASSIQMPQKWPNGTMVSLVELEPHDGKLGIKVLSQPNYSSQGTKWNAAFEAIWLESSNLKMLKQVLDRMQRGLSGMERMPYHGKECVWAYGPVKNTSFHLMVILPYQEVIAEAATSHQQAITHTQNQLQRAQVVLVSIIPVVLVVAFLSSRAVTRPIRELVLATRQVSQGMLNTRVQIQTRDEMEELGDAFNGMIPQLQDRMRIKGALELAREVQQQLLPIQSPRIPGFDIAGQSIYCDETGGDYYDYLEFSRQGVPHFGVAIGDVSGHGIAAAMLMAAARSLLRAKASECTSLSQLFTHINQQLSHDVTAGRFMTLFYIQIDAAQNSMRWISAGHDPAIFHRPSTSAPTELKGDGPPLAIDPSQAYSEQGPLSFQGGDIIILGTDGVWEARNPQGERFGKERLQRLVSQFSHQSAKQITSAILEAVSNFREGSPQEDDITLVTIKRLA